MSGQALKLTVYFGERDRVADRFLADALIDASARAGIAMSLVMRGVEGFGIKHQLRTDRLLTLSEDLPLVAVAIDRPERIEPLAERVAELLPAGLVTIERARLLTDRTALDELREGLHEETKLTVYAGRNRRHDGTPATVSIVRALHEHRVAGASVLLGVDGTVRGQRVRARFFAANRDVPAMTIAVGRRAPIAAALDAIVHAAPDAILTAERVRVCKRDGRRLAAPHDLPARDGHGRELWHKFMVYTGGQAHHEGQPLAPLLLRRLRHAGALGATTLRGTWGYHGDHRPHGDTPWQLRRHVPLVTVCVERPERTRRLFEVIDELTDATGLVTGEVVPAFLARSGATGRGALRLARPR